MAAERSDREEPRPLDETRTGSRQELLQSYLSGEVVEEEEELWQDETRPGDSRVRSVAQAVGGAAGAVVGGALGAVAGLPLAMAGVVAGVAAGALAGTAIGREWVRGENVSDALEFDQPDVAAREAEEPLPPAHRPHIVSVGNILHRTKLGAGRGAKQVQTNTAAAEVTARDQAGPDSTQSTPFAAEPSPPTVGDDLSDTVRKGTSL